MSYETITKRKRGGNVMILGYKFRCDVEGCESITETTHNVPMRPKGWDHIKIDSVTKVDLILAAHLDLCLLHTGALTTLLGPFKWRTLSGEVIDEPK